jgi:hypothetical protein
MSLAVVSLAYDPNDVKPGWIALVIVALLALATFLLWRSMNTQLGRIKVPKKGEEPQRNDDAAPGGQAETPSSDEDGEQGGDRPTIG